MSLICVKHKDFILIAEDGATDTRSCYLDSNNAGVNRTINLIKSNGISVRCIQD